MSAKTLLVLLLFVVSGFATAQDQPPFIYYPYGYGYIIERADGTDSHFIDGAADQATVYRDAMWSPSGTWLAWRAEDSRGCGTLDRRSQELIVANAETAHLVSYEDWVRFTWSRRSDQLLVLSSNNDLLQWSIIDPAAPYVPLASGIINDSAGDAAALLQDFFEHGQTPAARNDSLEQAAASADGQWLAYIDDGPVMVDRATGETHLIAPSVHGYGGNRGGYVKWHPSRNWFISIEEGVAGCGSAYHTQVTNGDTRYEVDYSNSVEWLPPQVDPASFPRFEKPPQPRPFKTLEAPETISRLIWSDDGRSLYAYTGYGDSPDPLVAWDVETGELLQNVEFPPVFIPQPSDAFAGMPLLAESDSYNVVPTGVYDKQSGQQAVVFQSDLWTLGGVFQISSNERVVIGSALIQPLYVWSLTTGETLFQGLTATAAAISPDSVVVAVASGWDVHLYTSDAFGF